jgi:hypothetical protein
MADKDLVVRTLRELVDALDRRVAHVERLGEARIARDAAGLRKEALRRIQELTAESSDRETREAERSGGVMTDDGGPPKKEALTPFSARAAATDGARHNPSRWKCARMTA